MYHQLFKQIITGIVIYLCFGVGKADAQHTRFRVLAVTSRADDHKKMMEMAKRQLRYKAALHPILFELLPSRFTIPQLQILYEGIYDTTFDNRNFSRKVLSTELLIKQKEKDKANSKKGAFYYKLDKRKYKANFQAFLNFIPNPDKLLM